MALEEAYEPIGQELREVESLITKILSGVEDGNLSRMNALLLSSKGKRLRPAFVLLMAHALNEKEAKRGKSSLIKAAAAFELIHMATLVHDDVMDSSTGRHGKPTVNKKYGISSAIGLGDYLFSLAFVLLAQTRRPELLETAAKAIAEVCEGQIYQLSRRGSAALSMEEGTLIIGKKTAALFAAACSAGALIAKGDTSKAWEFGRHFGMAFQVLDDYLDIMGTEELLGKLPGENLKQGELTIPLMMLLGSLPAKKRAAMKGKLFKQGIKDIRTSMAQENVGRKVGALVMQEIKEALSSLPPSNTCTRSLQSICGLLEERLHGA